MEVPVGKITHYYGKIGVAAVEMSDTLEVGNLIHIKGHTTDFEQKVEAMQIEHEKVTKATKGQMVGLKVKDYVREHDTVYKVES
jgi:putative protease